MASNDIAIISRILSKHNRKDLSSLFSRGRGEVDESTTYGSYLFSTISQYLFYLPLDQFISAKQLSGEDIGLILDAVLYLYPHQERAPEIRDIGFRLLEEDVAAKETEIKIESKIDHDFAQEQIKKAIEKLDGDDYDGAITSAGSLLESVFADIYNKCTGEEIDSTANLRSAYKKLKSLIRLSDEQTSDESAQDILRGLSSIVSGMDAIRNQMGDRHRRLTKPWRRHAKLCVNSTKILVEFLYETLEYQKGKVESLKKELTSFLDSEKRFLGKTDLLQEKWVIQYITKCDGYLKSLMIESFTRDFQINKFRDSDIFFSALYVFFENITKENLTAIFECHKENSQACSGLKAFLKLVNQEKPQLLTMPIKAYLES